MPPKPKPPNEGPAQGRWYEEADLETRRAHPSNYWFHSSNGPPEFWWHETRVSEAEYRANAEPWALERLDSLNSA